MVNHNYGDENDGLEPRGSWVGLLLGGLLIGLLVGGLAGAGVMLLVAPRSGKRTRAKLQRRGAEWREQAADTLGNVAGAAQDKARQITHDVSKAA